MSHNGEAFQALTALNGSEKSGPQPGEPTIRSDMYVGSLEVASFHTALRRATRLPDGNGLGAAWESNHL